MSTSSSSTDSVQIAEEPKESPVSIVLGNADLLSLVFSEFMSEMNDTEEQKLKLGKDLLTAARTCSSFVEPALDVLWRVLPSMLPLFKLLPGFGLVEGVYIMEDIIESDWVRYDVHARRVRILDIGNPPPGDAKISSYAYWRIYANRKKQLLPALASVYASARSNVTIDYTPLFMNLHSNVESVSLGRPVVDNSKIFQSILAELKSAAPTLRELQIQGTGAVNIRPITQFKTLTTLNLHVTGTHLSPRFMDELDQLEKLEQLKLHVGPDSPSLVPPLLRASTSRTGNANTTVTKDQMSKFRKLKALEVTGKISSVARILEHMRLENLQQFTVVEEADPANANSVIAFWTNIFQSISASYSLIALKVVQLQRRSLGSSLSAASFQPLYSLRTLKWFVIENGSVNISDDDILAIGTAFPDLKELVLPDQCHMILMTAKFGACARSCATIMSLWTTHGYL